VVAIEGVVRPRPDESINKKMKTGFIEVNISLIKANYRVLIII
jgi:aspartyl-tRNA synthetase